MQTTTYQESGVREGGVAFAGDVVGLFIEMA